MKKIPRFARSVIPATGETRPRRDGPRTTPAKVSPSRAGNLSRGASSPEALAASRRRRRLSKMSMGRRPAEKRAIRRITWVSGLIPSHESRVLRGEAPPQPSWDHSNATHRRRRRGRGSQGGKAEVGLAELDRTHVGVKRVRDTAAFRARTQDDAPGPRPVPKRSAVEARVRAVTVPRFHDGRRTWYYHSPSRPT